jgi:hyperosmotically inducible periplasmic protein
LLFSEALLALGWYVGTAHPTEGTPALLAQTAPDNTGRNVRDRGGLTLTPGDQFESEADRPLTQEIRKAVVADDSLSTLAKNIKIITVDGVVTLRGPVQSLQEKETIETMAQQIAGIDKIDNQLSVTKIRGQSVHQAAHSSTWASATAGAEVDRPYRR